MAYSINYTNYCSELTLTNSIGRWGFIDEPDWKWPIKLIHNIITDQQRHNITVITIMC